MRALAGPEPDLEAAERLAAASPHYNSILRTTCVATQLMAGHAENALPRSATAVVNCRILPGVPVDDVESQLRRVLDDEAIGIERLAAAVPSPPTTLTPEMLTVLEELVDGMVPRRRRGPRPRARRAHRGARVSRRRRVLVSDVEAARRMRTTDGLRQLSGSSAKTSARQLTSRMRSLQRSRSVASAASTAFPPCRRSRRRQDQADWPSRSAREPPTQGDQTRDAQQRCQNGQAQRANGGDLGDR